MNLWHHIKHPLTQSISSGTSPLMQFSHYPVFLGWSECKPWCCLFCLYTCQPLSHLYRDSPLLSSSTGRRAHAQDEGWPRDVCIMFIEKSSLATPPRRSRPLKTIWSCLQVQHAMSICQWGSSLEIWLWRQLTLCHEWNNVKFSTSQFLPKWIQNCGSFAFEGLLIRSQLHEW